MKVKIKILIVGFTFAILTACVTIENVDKKNSTAANANGATHNSAVVQTTGNENSGAGQTSVNGANATDGKVENGRNPQLSDNGVPLGANVKVNEIDPKKAMPPPVVTLGDGSEMTATLGANGAVETRTFKVHTLLEKMVKTTNGNDVQIKIYLKNGKVISVDKDKIRNFSNDSADQILLAAGVGPISAPSPQAGKPQIKKEGNVQVYTF